MSAEEHHEFPQNRESVASVHSDETLRGEEQDEPTAERPREQRVRFRSLSGDQDILPAERLEHPDYPRQPFHPPPRPGDDDSERQSEDVTSANRAETGDGWSPPEKQSNVDGSPDKKREENIEEANQLEKEKEKQRKLFSFDKAKRAWNADKAREIARKLGRSPLQGDGLTSSIPDTTWAGDEGIALSNMTDDHRKTDEQRRKDQAHATSEAHRLVRELTQHRSGPRTRPRPRQPSEEGIQTHPPDETKLRTSGGGILGNLLKLHHAQQGQDSRSSSTSTDVDSEGGQTSGYSTPSSGTATPHKEKLKWYKKDQNRSTSSLMLSSAARKRKHSGKPRLEDEIRVTVHIAEIISRQRYLMQLCRALMKFGAPTHRLEEYMQMTARVLEVDAQFLYLPGCMIMSFDDSSTRTAEFKLIRVVQGVDLSRLADTHSVYKNVVHDLIGVDEAAKQLEDIMNRKPKFPTWFLVFMYGLASATVGPFAFNARPIDMPISFILGMMLGFMQLVLAPRSTLYSNVFEVFASVLTSFLARAFGSIRWGMVDGKQQYLFCFSSIAQSAIALILPGFLVLSSSLELQSHQMIAGSIRMVYAIIYSLFLGYGITVGVTIYGLMDGNANSNTSCPPSPIKNPYLQRFPFVLAMSIWLVILNQGKFKQAPVMMIIAFTGYAVNYLATKRIGSNSEVANTLGAFTIGVLGNLYSRLWHGHAATAILPGIFVLVPSGLAATGTLISGVASADQIRGNVTGHKNESSVGGSESSGGGGGGGMATNTSVFNLGFGMIQVAIGITVGLFIAALLVYPYGKRRSGLFSF